LKAASLLVWGSLVILLIIAALLLSVAGLKAQSISHIETTKNWYCLQAARARGYTPGVKTERKIVEG